MCLLIRRAAESSMKEALVGGGSWLFICGKGRHEWTQGSRSQSTGRLARESRPGHSCLAQEKKTKKPHLYSDPWQAKDTEKLTGMESGFYVSGNALQLTCSWVAVWTTAGEITNPGAWYFVELRGIAEHFLLWPALSFLPPAPILFLLYTYLFSLSRLISAQLPLEVWYFPLPHRVLSSLALQTGLSIHLLVFVTTMLSPILCLISFRVAVSQDHWWQETEKRWEELQKELAVDIAPCSWAGSKMCL